MAVKMLTAEQLATLTTPRLLAYRNRMLKVREGPHWDVVHGHGDPVTQTEVTKQSPEWQEAYELLKSELGKREHVQS